MLVEDLPRAHLVAPWVPFFLVVSAIVTLGCVVAMWRMHKWSVFAYACWAALGTLVVIAFLGIFNLHALVVRVVVIAVSFYFICGPNVRRAEPCAAPNDGPAMQLGDSGVTEGPPSVS